MASQLDALIAQDKQVNRLSDQAATCLHQRIMNNIASTSTAEKRSFFNFNQPVFATAFASVALLVISFGLFYSQQPAINLENQAAFDNWMMTQLTGQEEFNTEQKPVDFKGFLGLEIGG